MSYSLRPNHQSEQGNQRFVSKGIVKTIPRSMDALAIRYDAGNVDKNSITMTAIVNDLKSSQLEELLPRSTRSMFQIDDQMP